MLPLGDVFTRPIVPLMPGDAPMVVEYLHQITVVLYLHTLAHVAVWHAVVVTVFAQVDVGDLLHLGPAVLAYLVDIPGQRLQQGTVEFLEALFPAHLCALQEMVVVFPLQGADGLIDLIHTEEG